MVKFPEEYDLLDFFGARVIENSAPHDGYFEYVVANEKGLTVKFSFNIFEKSVQSLLKHEGQIIAVFSQEGASLIEIQGDRERKFLAIDFNLDETASRMLLRVDPEICVRWESTMR